MAKDKQIEETYRIEGLRRASIRKDVRKDSRRRKYLMYGRGSAKCEYCSGAMTWCSCCEVWSSTCCQRYGTCQCS